ncbi:hypothetical protein KIL84_002386 [Mauremys mutica]|uniref:Uncharacterized protein n=1 Tax=Mauremys mutica TaxID=74926 RepID=A0A9D3X7F8_9SAUR|nr:hypothetical protein KIL84_002386 [Mauremys mutica]
MAEQHIARIRPALARTKYKTPWFSVLAYPVCSHLFLTASVSFQEGFFIQIIPALTGMQTDERSTPAGHYYQDLIAHRRRRVKYVIQSAGRGCREMNALAIYEKPSVSSGSQFSILLP